MWGAALDDVVVVSAEKPESILCFPEKISALCQKLVDNLTGELRATRERIRHCEKAAHEAECDAYEAEEAALDAADELEDCSACFRDQAIENWKRTQDMYEAEQAEILNQAAVERAREIALETERHALREAIARGDAAFLRAKLGEIYGAVPELL